MAKNEAKLQTSPCRPGRSTQTWSISYSLMVKASSVSSTTVQFQAYDAQPTPFHHSA